MKKLKKIILAVLCVVCVISLTPSTAMVQARDWDAIEKATQEAKKTNYWTKNGNKKYVVEKTYDMDKINPNDMVKLLLDDANSQEAFGKVIFPKFKIKASSESDANKKIDAYLKKMKKVSENKYGLGFGLERKNPTACNYVKYDKKKKVATYHVEEYTTYDMYVIQKLFDLAMNEPYLEVHYRSKDAYVGDKNFYRQKTRSVFKNAAELKKASDSVKFQFLCEYLNNSCKIAWGKPETLYDTSLKAVLEGRYYGVCADCADLWRRLAGLVSYDIESRQYTCWRETADTSHTALLLRAKNKDGNWDYFQGNNAHCVLFGHAFLKDYDKKIDIYADATSQQYNNIEDWMHYDYKAYVTNKGEFGKNAYKYGKNHKKSELVNLMISKKAKYL